MTKSSMSSLPEPSSPSQSSLQGFSILCFVKCKRWESSVADPGSGAFLNPWIRDEHFRFHFRELRNNFLVSKILKFFDADPDPGSEIFLTLDPGWRKFGIRINLPDPTLVDS
jgi:hypothetical protein